SVAAPKKITLKRKTTTTLKTGSGSSRKTVNVEVRKKRTYVKRDAAYPVYYCGGDCRVYDRI
ncbi:MAG TPA: translation initiation factor IF-2 associated domain-containing protein, partial [Bacteroidia bacterium]|nr:translation initiation factor IF-2 associated domain-containing protein [Bacteroidia bacterium]